MLVEVKRRKQWETDIAVMSDVFLDGAWECFGLEPGRYAPVHPGHPCIAAGTFDVEMTKSPHFGFFTPELANVPGRSDIRWHPANYPVELLGCLGVGQTRAKEYVGQSRLAFQALMVKLSAAIARGEKITAAYTDEP